jgi:hypothetical protein
LNHKSSDRVERPEEECKVSCEEIIHRIVALGIYPNGGIVLSYWLLTTSIGKNYVLEFESELHVAEPVVKNITIPLLIILTKMEKSRISVKCLRHSPSKKSRARAWALFEPRSRGNTEKKALQTP